MKDNLTRTQGPLVRTVFKKIGGTSKNHSTGNSTPAKKPGLVTIGGGGGGGRHSKQRSQTFQRLQDDHKYGMSDSDLRPEHGDKINVTVTGTTAGSDSGSGDEIPLRAIMRQTEVEWSEERIDTERKAEPARRGF
jgi:hypothetical protein